VASSGTEGNSHRQSLGPRRASSGVPSAGVGKAASLGSLSVPPGWAMAASPVEPVSSSESASSDAPADVVGRPPGRAFQEALMATMSGSGGPLDATGRNKADKDDSGVANNDENPTPGATRKHPEGD
jgi:hypothetical protein